jgi:TRAP-type C4-dicarboxylate transport system substrate-binding protein
MRKLAFVFLSVMFCAAATAQTHEIMIGTIVPSHAAWAKGMVAAGNEINERTEGRVKLKFRFAQKSDAVTLRNMRTRRFQGGMFTPGALQDQYPDITLYSLPLVFNSKEEADFIRSRMDEKLLDGLNEAGYVSFGFSATGFAVLMSNEPVSSVADIKGKQVWVPERDPISYSAMKALGVNPQPHPLGDVLVGLQTNLYDMIAVSPVGALVMQWHTKVKYLTEMPLVYTFGFLAIDKTAFGKIEAQDQDIVSEVLARVHAEFDKTGIEDDAAAKQSLFNTGIKAVVPGEDELEEIREILANNNRKLAQQGEFSEDLYNEMMGYIEQYRSEHAEDDIVAAH